MDRCHRVYRSRLEWVSGLGLNWVKTIQILLNVGKSKRWKVFFWREWSILLNTDHIFLFLTPSTDSKAGILVPLRRNWSDYFQFLCSFVSNWNFFSTRGSRCCDTTKWKWICTGVPNRICTGVFRMEKQKCQKQKECLKYKTNKQTQRESMTICVLNNSDLVEFLVLHVGFSFAMQQFINGVSTLKCYSFEIRK